MEATHLAAVVPAGHHNGLRWTDPEPDAAGNTYVVTALDRLWNESAPAQQTVR